MGLSVLGRMLALAVALGLLAVSGCGSSDNGVAGKSAKEILQASKAAAVGADSVHVLAKNAQGRLSFTSDLELSRDGGHARFVSLLGFHLDVIQIGETVDVKRSPLGL